MIPNKCDQEQTLKNGTHPTQREKMISNYDMAADKQKDMLVSLARRRLITQLIYIHQHWCNWECQWVQIPPGVTLGGGSAIHSPQHTPVMHLAATFFQNKRSCQLLLLWKKCESDCPLLPLFKKEGNDVAIQVNTSEKAGATLNGCSFPPFLKEQNWAALRGARNHIDGNSKLG